MILDLAKWSSLVSMNQELSPEHILGALLELRNYHRLRQWVSKYIEEHGWSYVIQALRRGRALEAVVLGGDNPLREGILQTGMIVISDTRA